MKTLRIGSRESDLALVQSRQVKELFNKFHPYFQIDIVPIQTKADKEFETSIKDFSGKGVFTNELENALLNKTIDLAVHSLKDLKVELSSKLIYIGSPIRQDVRDVLISKEWRAIDEIPIGGEIATGSNRRKAQLLNLRPDLHIRELRGNINTRLKKLEKLIQRQRWKLLFLILKGKKKIYRRL